MKKIFFMAFVALSVSAMAQQVTPVTISLAEFKVDSLRTLYGSEPIMYRASLDAVAQALEKNATELKAAKAELKSEQQLTKEMESSLKGATKMAASMKKLYSKEEGELKSMQKVVTGQQKMLTKQKELNDETREAFATAADHVIVEAEQIVEVGELDPDEIMTPHFIVDAVVQGRALTEA